MDANRIDLALTVRNKGCHSTRRSIHSSQGIGCENWAVHISPETPVVLALLTCGLQLNNSREGGVVENTRVSSYFTTLGEDWFVKNPGTSSVRSIIRELS